MKLTKRIPQAVEKFNTEVDKTDDEALSKQLTVMKKQANTLPTPDFGAKLNKLFSSSDVKQPMKELFAQKLEYMIPQLSVEITKAGGLAAYVIQAKSKLQDAKNKTASLMKTTNAQDRNVASSPELEHVLSIIATASFGIFIVTLFFGLFMIPIIGGPLLLGSAAITIIATLMGGDQRIFSD